MLKKLMEKYYQFGFKKVLDEYKNYSKDEKAYAWFVVSETIKNEPIITHNRTLLEFRFYKFWKSIILLFPLSLILGNYFFSGKIYLFFILMCFFLMNFLSFKEHKYLRRKFKDIDDEIEKEIKELEKKQRACNLYLKEK